MTSKIRNAALLTKKYLIHAFLLCGNQKFLEIEILIHQHPEKKTKKVTRDLVFFPQKKSMMQFIDF